MSEERTKKARDSGEEPVTKTEETAAGRRVPGGRVALVFLLLSASVLLLGGGLGLAWLVTDYKSYINSPDPALQERKMVEIEKGMNFSAVAQKLAREQVISRPLYFRALARLKKVDTKIKAGQYEFQAGLTPAQVLDILTRGEVAVWWLVVPEGLDIFQVARRVGELGPWSRERFLAAAQDRDKAEKLGIPGPTFEGYLFPAVYELTISTSEEELVEMMAKRALKEKTEERLKKAAALGLSWHEVIILASMVEKEAAKREEMGRIASVFLNRLQRGMPLQSDPTAVYGLPDFEGPVTPRDLRRRSPYNTYLHKGLPPGPICNPGAAAILAVLNPEKTNYLYFVAKGDGSHAFSETYREHLRNIWKYRRRR